MLTCSQTTILREDHQSILLLFLGGMSAEVAGALIIVVVKPIAGEATTQSRRALIIVAELETLCVVLSFD